MTDLVIGSGPAGIAATLALLDRGRSVVLLDGGRSLEPASEARRVAASGAQWSESRRSTWQAPQFDAQPGQVRRYGSDFAMEPKDQTWADADGVALRASRAAGGLSNLWGGAVLPYTAQDMQGWPIGPDDFAPHYTAIARHIPIAGRADALAGLFPSVSMEGRHTVPPSPQAGELLRRLDLRGMDLAAQGVRVGLARQAVAPGCRQCGQCLHGCPWGLIWSARQSLSTLVANPRVTYRPGAVVRRFTEDANGITLHLEDGSDIQGSRAFLGAGVLETARILLASRPGTGSLTLRDSQQAFLPTLHRWPAPRRPDRGDFHTLPQIFVEIDNPDISPHLVHSQVYTWNEYFPRDLTATYGRKLPGSGPALAALARRLVVAQTFLHSDHSHRIGLRLSPDGRLVATVQRNPETDQTTSRALRLVSTALRSGGLLPLRFAARHGAPGASFHVGASVPMSATPQDGKSDRLGRPHGLSRLHLIDASSLPAIPATTITLGVMANAHRIATAAL